MSRNSKKHTSVASGKFPTLQTKQVVAEHVDRYPVYYETIGCCDQDGWKWDGKKYTCVKDNTEWRDGPLTAKFKLVDATSGGSVLPSFVFQNEKGEFALMTIAHFRSAVLARKLDMVDGMIAGTFKLVEYRDRYNFYRYLEVV